MRTPLNQIQRVGNPRGGAETVRGEPLARSRQARADPRIDGLEIRFWTGYRVSTVK